MLHYVNHNVKQAELYQKLMDYKGRLDLTALEKSSSSIASMYKVCTCYIQNVASQLCTVATCKSNLCTW